MSKPIEDDIRDAAGRRVWIDDYPKLHGLKESTLLRGYRSKIAPEALERPVTPVFDESGLMYGEPLSKGRAGLPEGDRT